MIIINNEIGVYICTCARTFTLYLSVPDSCVNFESPHRKEVEILRFVGMTLEMTTYKIQ